MATRSPTPAHSDWGTSFASAAQLPNVNGATVQSPFLEVGDTASVPSLAPDLKFFCVDATLNAAIWVPFSQGNNRFWGTFTLDPVDGAQGLLPNTAVAPTVQSLLLAIGDVAYVRTPGQESWFVCVSPGTGALPRTNAVWLGRREWPRFRNGTRDQDDYNFGFDLSEEWIAAAPAGTLGWTVANAAGGNTNSVVGEVRAPGICQVATGIGVLGIIGGSAVSLGTQTMARDGTGNQLLYYQMRARLPVLTDPGGGASFISEIGFGDGGANTVAVDGLFFRYTSPGPNWFAVTRANGVETATNTGVAATVGFQRFEMYDPGVNATGVQFFLNDVLVATHTTNIPTGVGREFAPMQKCRLTAALITLATRVTQIDYFRFGAAFPNGR